MKKNMALPVTRTSISGYLKVSIIVIIIIIIIIIIITLLQSSRNRKFAKLVLRLVFKSLETFLESLQLSDFNEMQSKVTWDFTWAFSHVSFVK